MNQKKIMKKKIHEKKNWNSSYAFKGRNLFLKGIYHDGTLIPL